MKQNIRQSAFPLLFFLTTVISITAQLNSFSGVQGEIWLDDTGKYIQAHGGQVQKIGNTWWWIGENRDGNKNICLYSSQDLYNWENEGYALRTVSNRSDLDNDSYFTTLYGHLSNAGKDSIYDGIRSSRLFERPKLIHNKKTGKYIIWYHADDSNYRFAGAGVAIADDIRGPYRFIKRSRLHQLPDDQYGNQWYEEPGNRGMARDMALFVDDDDTAYIIYSSEENRTMFISRLNDEYTDLDVPQTPVGLAENGKDFIRLHQGRQREAPAMFKYDGKYYMITSGATGWEPNRAEYWVADEIFGTWKVMGDPCLNEVGIPCPATLTFRTQSTNIIPYDAENGKFIYMGDRWNASKLSDSRYVWLPIFISSNGEIQLRSMSDWNLELFNVKFDASQFANLYFSNETLPKKITTMVLYENEWKEEMKEVVWEGDISLFPPVATMSIVGTFDLQGTQQKVSVKGVNIPKKLVYFIDCGATASSLHDSITAKGLAPILLNQTTHDQPFTEGADWGYTSKVGTKESEADIDYRNKESKDAFTSGWFAWADKTIDYKLKIKNKTNYRLTAGFQEWWNTGRNMRTYVSYYNNNNEADTLELGEFYNYTESVQDYSFRLDDLNEQQPYITISIAKTGNPDSVLSWLALVDLESGSYQNKIQTNKSNVYLRQNILFVLSQYHTNISIYNTTGQLLSQQESMGTLTQINLRYQSGMYLVKVGDHNITKILLK